MAKKPKADEFDREAETPETAEREDGAEPGEQLRLLDTEHPAHKDIVRLAKKIRTTDKDRADAQGRRDDAAEEMRELLQKHNLPHVVVSDYEIDLKPPKVSVKQRAEVAG